MITTEQRAAWQALADATEPGPWYAHPGGHYVYSPEQGGLVQNWNGDWDAKSGMEFIAAARTAVPALLAALRETEADEPVTDHDRMNYWWRQAKEARAERDALAHQVEAVRAMHRPVEVEPSDTICAACSTLRGSGESLRYFPTEEWPCPTIRALDGEV